MNKSTIRFRRFVDGIYQIAGIFSALCIVGIFVMILAQIIWRQFGSHIPSSGDAIGFFVSWSAFLGLAYTMRHQAHIRVELVASRLSKKSRRWLNVVVAFAATILLGFMSYYIFDLVYQSFDYGDVTDGEIPIPLWLVQLPMLIGIALFTLSMLDYALMGIFNPHALEKNGLVGDGS